MEPILAVLGPSELLIILLLGLFLLLLLLGAIVAVVIVLAHRRSSTHVDSRLRELEQRLDKLQSKE